MSGAGERRRSRLRAQLSPEDRRAVCKVLVPLSLADTGLACMVRPCTSGGLSPGESSGPQGDVGRRHRVLGTAFSMQLAL